MDFSRREAKEKDENGVAIAGIYIDLFKHYPDIYYIFKLDVPEEIRDTEPQTSLEDILGSLKESLTESYGAYHPPFIHAGTSRIRLRSTFTYHNRLKTGAPFFLPRIETASWSGSWSGPFFLFHLFHLVQTKWEFNGSAKSDSTNILKFYSIMVYFPMKTDV